MDTNSKLFEILRKTSWLFTEIGNREIINHDNDKDDFQKSFVDYDYHYDK